MTTLEAMTETPMTATPQFTKQFSIAGNTRRAGLPRLAWWFFRGPFSCRLICRLGDGRGFPPTLRLRLDQRPHVPWWDRGALPRPFHASCRDQDAVPRAACYAPITSEGVWSFLAAAAPRVLPLAVKRLYPCTVDSGKRAPFLPGAATPGLGGQRVIVRLAESFPRVCGHLPSRRDR